MIRLDQLTKTFDTPNGPIVAADRISMEVASGDICVLLGPSGCGKTTTLKMINRIVPPTSGEVFIDGQDTSKMETLDLRRNIGYVIQQIGLFPNMTIEENICLVPKFLGWDKARYKKRARELMDVISLDCTTFLRRYPHELSGGQQQRVGVARALAADPPVMLLDEPFGAIDPINRASLQTEFLNMQKVLKKTVLLVSHDVDEALRMGDSIAIFREGRLIQRGAPDELLANPIDSFVESFFGEDRALKRLQLIAVGDVATQNVVTVNEGDSVELALRRMNESGYRDGIVMIDVAGRPQGIITRAIAASTKGLCKDRAVAVQQTVSMHDDLRKVASLMFAHDITWIACVDKEGKMCGHITQALMTHFLASRYRPSARSEHDNARIANADTRNETRIQQRSLLSAGRLL